MYINREEILQVNSENNYYPCIPVRVWSNECKCVEKYFQKKKKTKRKFNITKKKNNNRAKGD